jgi:UDP-galactopyranose mutase
MNNVDLLIVGAGPVGCVVAEQAATKRGWKSLLIDKRSHLAGNCFDGLHDSGVLIHKYGPHYFRTNSEQLYSYLSQFTEWVPGQYFVKVKSKERLYSFPINLITLEQFFQRPFDEESAKKLLEEIRVPIAQPKNSEEFVLSRVGPKLYETFYLGYTLKQWERHPKDLDPSVCGRIPVRFNRDERYVDHKYQVTPKEGFTSMFKKMVKKPQIEFKPNVDYREIKNQIVPKVATVYCGPADEYFDYKLGKLPWRSLDFEFREYKKEFVQPCVQINYPTEYSYTRSVEIKHTTHQKSENTVVSYEYPREIGDPYYPVPSAEANSLFSRYKELIERETASNAIYFSGRLANYKYLNTDEAIESAFKTFDQIVSDWEKKQK